MNIFLRRQPTGIPSTVAGSFQEDPEEGKGRVRGEEGGVAGGEGERLSERGGGGGGGAARG